MVTTVTALTTDYAAALLGPTHIERPFTAKANAQLNGTTWTQLGTSFRGGYLGLAAVGDYVEHEILLTAGSWVLTMEDWVGASLGRYIVTLDGVQVGIVDQYSSGSTLARRTEALTLSVTSPGRKLLRFTVTSKNASAGATAVRLSALDLTRKVPTSVPASTLTWSYLNSYFFPHSIGTDGVVYGHSTDAAAAHGDRTLARSSDGGVTVERGQDLGAGGLMAAGEYIIWSGRTTAGYVVITSSDASVAGNFGGIYFSASFGSGFTKVQTIKGTNEFSVSKPEIGQNQQTWLAVGEYSTDAPQPAHVLWHSSDGGQTWRNIKTAGIVDSSKNSHFHGAAHQLMSDGHLRLWSSQGDNANSLFTYTDNPEAASPTFTTVNMDPAHPLYNQNASPQPTTVGVFAAAAVLFTTPDRSGSTSGVWTASTATPENPESAFVSPNAEQGQNVFGRSPYAQSDSRAVVCIPDRLEGTLKAYFVGTGDSGKTWHLLYTMDLTSLGSGSAGVIGPDSAGLIYYKNPASNPAPAGTSLMVAQMPTFRPVT